MARTGAMGGIVPGDDVSQGIALKCLAAIEAKVNTAFEVFHVLEYATQLVAGKNYFLKIDTGDKALHARIYVGFDGNAQLAAVRFPLDVAAELSYFQDDEIRRDAPPAVKAGGAAAPGAARPGGMVSKPADDTSNVIAAAVKEAVEGALKTTYETFEVFEYATQVVAGTNYFLKVFVGEDEFLHIRVFKGFDGIPHLVRLFPGRTAGSALEYF
eukprot:c45557_g1_i1.p2 GENE.c45557_g1_i1~~c45557_g1_i1.p2  ORF type:complete len:229 (+),score=48.68 c45557_g1_i1:50-688(+)